MSEQKTVKRTFGLWTTVSIIVGLVVGASIFSLPGQLAAATGPGVWISYVIAGIMVTFTCVVAAQVGGIIQQSGSTTILVKRAFNEKTSVVYTLSYIVAYSINVTFLSISAAAYTQVMLPGVPLTILVLVWVLVPGVVNLSGNKVLSVIQNGTVAFMLIIIALFCMGSFSNINVENFSPMFPVGVFPILASSVTLFFTYAGFFSIADIAGDIKDPGKNIPRGAIIAFFIVLIMYCSMVLALVAYAPYTELGSNTIVFDISSKIFPSWVATGITIGILFAIYTSIVVSIQAISRLCFGMAEESVFPQIFLRVNKSNIPWMGVVIACILAIIGYSLSSSLVQIANVIVSLLLFIYIIVAIASMRIKELFPDEYNASDFKLKNKAYYFWPIGLIAVSLLYAATMFKSDLFALGVGAISVFIFWIVSPLLIKKKNKNISS